MWIKSMMAGFGLALLFTCNLVQAGYANENPISNIDPTGLDAYVANTPQVGGYHEKIVVDTPTGAYGQSFGMSDINAPMQGPVEAYGVTPRPGQPGSGIVYPDNDPIIKIQTRLKTSPVEDVLIKHYLEQQLGNTGPYNVMTNSCRTYSNGELDNIREMINRRRQQFPN